MAIHDAYRRHQQQPWIALHSCAFEMFPSIENLVENAASQYSPSTGLLISIMGKIELRIDLLLLDFFFHFYLRLECFVCSSLSLYLSFFSFSFSIHATSYGNKMLSSTKFILNQQRREQSFSYFALLDHIHVAMVCEIQWYNCPIDPWQNCTTKTFASW